MGLAGVIGLLRILNVAAAALLAAIAFRRLFREGNLVPLVLFIGLLIAGPVEDVLRRFLLEAPYDPGPPVNRLIDQSTSLALILCLIAASLLAR
ncbi:MAG TPA: hypothetical protein VF282_07365 [Bacillota bacterium]